MEGSAPVSGIFRVDGRARQSRTDPCRHTGGALIHGFRLPTIHTSGQASPYLVSGMRSRNSDEGLIRAIDALSLDKDMTAIVSGYRVRVQTPGLPGFLHPA